MNHNTNQNDHCNFYNFPNPNYICPTNIPLLQNSSLNSYFDMFNEIDQNESNDNQCYLKSVFNDTVKENKAKQKCSQK